MSDAVPAVERSLTTVPGSGAMPAVRSITTTVLIVFWCSYDLPNSRHSRVRFHVPCR
jgi:hypothetical protein